MAKLKDLKVRIRDAEGRYLAGDALHYWFAPDSARAIVFDYVADDVEARLALIARTQGMVLKAVPVEPKEFLESCDQCRRMIIPSQAFFDGSIFLCRACKRKLTTVSVRS